MTPPINTVGVFKVLSPFAVVDGAVYKCESIRGFESLTEEGVDIFATFYSPHNLTKEQFDTDRKNSVDIVSLISITEDTVVLPSSFIASFPNTSSIDYQQTFMVLDLGLLPAELDLSGPLAECKELVDATLGTDLRTAITSHPVVGVIDASRHEQLTNARLANINTPDSFAKQLKIALDKLQKKTQHIATLEEELAKRL